MNIYQVGDKVCMPGAGGIIFDMTDAGGVLLMKVSSPTSAEKRAFKQNVSFRHTVVEDIIFILTRVGTMPWGDAPYARQFSQQLTKIDPIDDGMGIAVHAMLIDSTTGVLVAQKLISLSTEESRSLRDDIIKQPVIPDFDARLQRIFATYSTADLVKKSAEGWD